MSRTEITVPSLLRTLADTENVPEDFLPLEPMDERVPDETKPLRGAFESILLARAAGPALDTLSEKFAKEHDKPWFTWNMIPIDEIDSEEDFQTKVELLERKRSYVNAAFLNALKRSLRAEFDSSNRSRLPRDVAFAYNKLEDSERPLFQDTPTFDAAGTIGETIGTLFHIAAYDYPRVLGYNPSARQMVDLAANSYTTFVHPTAVRHIQVDVPLRPEWLILNQTFTIDTSNSTHAVVLKDPGQYVHRENEMRERGEILSQTIHCPFSTSSRFTEPFLDSDAEPFDSNPLKHTFTTLVRDFIGS